MNKKVVIPTERKSPLLELQHLFLP